MKKEIKCDLAIANIIEWDGKEVLAVYGIREKYPLVREFQETNGTEATLRIIMGRLDFYTRYPENEADLDNKIRDAKEENQETWVWESALQDTDPIKLMFESSLTFRKA